MVEELSERVHIAKDVLDPCCGSGVVAQVLKKHHVHCIDLDPRFSSVQAWRGCASFSAGDCRHVVPHINEQLDIICNPPWTPTYDMYSIVDCIVQHRKGAAMILLPTAYFNNGSKSEIWQRYPADHVIVFPRRLGDPHYNLLGTHQTAAWFCWGVKLKTQPKTTLEVAA